jgi:hypothetical protein
LKPKSEKDIFDFLEIKYVKSKDRLWNLLYWYLFGKFRIKKFIKIDRIKYITTIR